jgi:Adenylate kinase and related kinases
MKIVIIGYSGSGKSTLAENLARHYSIPKLHMDTLQFQPGWIDSDRDWMEGQMKQFLSQHKDWVIDGNYSWCCYEERMEQADHIIFLNFSRWSCLYRAAMRVRQRKLYKKITLLKYNVGVQAALYAKER